MVAARTYVYGVLDEGIVVLERTQSEYLERIWRTSRQATTWGEFHWCSSDRSTCMSPTSNGIVCQTMQIDVLDSLSPGLHSVIHCTDMTSQW